MADGDVFRHGVASADPRADRVLLWTRVSGADGPVEVDWTLARDEELEDVVAAGTAVAHPDHDWTVTVDAVGLRPRERYWYAFEALGERSPLGRTWTMPDAGRGSVRFAVCSCAKFTAGHYNVYARIADRDDLDFVLHLGDYIYEYPEDDGKAPGPAIGRPVEPKHECLTLDDYRRRYAHHRGDPDLRRLHARYPFVSTLDDHEICDNAWRENAKKHDPDEGAYLRRKTAALQAWREWIPSRADDTVRPVRIYRHVRLGALADLLVLDGRTLRDEQAKGPQRLEPDRTILGADQEAWLFERLAESQAPWRLVANSVMIGQVASDLMPDDLGEPLTELGILADTDSGPDPDHWDGYPAGRDRLLAQLRNEAGATVFLSGDVHTAWAVELWRDLEQRSGPPAGYEFVTSSVTSENLDEETRELLGEREADVEIERHVREENPHVRWVDLDRHGFVVLDVDEERVQADYWFVDRLDRPSEGLEHGASWVVRRREPGLVEADGPVDGRP